MKKMVVLFCFFSVATVSAQNFLVVDSNEKTAAIFDYENPRSLVRLLDWNFYYLEDFDKSFMDQEDVNDLNAAQRANLLEFIGEPGSVPIVDWDPDSPRYGEELIVYDTLTGWESYVYESPDTMFMDVSGITRLVLEYEEGKSPLIERVKRVTFCKKYNVNYVPVMAFEGNDILLLDGFQFLDQVLEDQVERLGSDHRDSYWSQLRDSSAVSNYTYYLETEYFPPYDLFSMYTGFDHVPQKTLSIEESEDSRYVDYSGPWRYPFDFKYGEEHSERDDFIHFLENSFDSTDYVVHQIDIPAIDEDPNSAEFGEYLIEMDSLGIFAFVYPEPEVYVRWVEFDFESAYTLGSIINGETGFDVSTEKLIFTQSDSEGEHAVLIHNLTDRWRALVGDAGIKRNLWKEWYVAYLTALETGKKYNGSKEKHRNQMNMSASFWK